MRIRQKHQNKDSFVLKSMAFMVALIGIHFSAMASSEQNTLVVNFAPGEVIQLIAPISTPEKQAARARYYQDAIPLAQDYGFKNLGQLKIEKTLIGEFKPGVVVFGSWPSKSSLQSFANHPKWPALKATRVEAWEELNLYNSEITHPTTLKFTKDKTYTIAFAWTNPENPKDYFQYLERIEPLLHSVGGRFILKIIQPELEAHDSAASAPQQITFVEWDTPDGLRKLQEIPEYKEHFKLFETGVSHFEFHLAEVKK